MSDDQGPSLSMMGSHPNFGFHLRVLPKVFVFFCIPWVCQQRVEETYLHVCSLSTLSHEQLSPSSSPLAGVSSQALSILPSQMLGSHFLIPLSGMETRRNP